MEIRMDIFKPKDLNLSEILGNISISDGRRKSVFKDTFLDSWFCTFVEGLISLKKKENVAIDLIEEPYEIYFFVQDNKYILEILDSIFIISDILKFETELRRLISDFLKQINYNSEKSELETLNYLNKFINNRDLSKTNIIQPLREISGVNIKKKIK